MSVNDMVGSLTEHAGLVLFLWVLANQAGAPVPAVPSLLAAGVLASRGNLSFVVILAVVVGGALIADLAWYALGRWRGAEIIAALRRFRRPRASADRIERFFLAHRFGFLWSARFLPELNPVGAGLAGATRVRPGCFLLAASGSALVWAATWAGAGYLLSEAIAR